MLPDPAEFQILETTAYALDTGIFLLAEHLERMQISAAQLSTAYGRSCFDSSCLKLESVRQQISDQLGDPTQPHRIRMLLDNAGHLSVQAIVMPPPEHPLSPPPLLVLDSQPTDTHSIFVRCKTTFRKIYDSAVDRIPPGFAAGTQVLLYNTHGMITEGNIANVAVSLPVSDEGSKNGSLALFTPPLSAGLLAGTMRQQLLNSGQIREAPISIDQFKQATDNGWPVLCMNSVRGLYPVTATVIK
ncbi:D-aminoacid aminotransferase-like PLP-dependent enzyme [Coemansia reversa NRRL 1564]|uniref:D-aminoacid aminotransferase-like PLP-dependent enzyme n=1 Tax=Coemansia reversa (strain ATCC 12441 / NRRL 1564) TaxID=763665 RepID=A0A2G5BEX9_COERN|nr:D-aminoacid aminotransferase-like PLP-dependent enzyme [Coemansia reversa NRRL 1564]|eukprot:PIA17563.1 D-aminoacid aminotransferase-like PLP-dependent enzyme [Coemansia reversa NRRL 1564]